MPLETMLRVYFLQNWYALSDPMAEETLYDSEAMRRFAGIELGDDRIPDETTILNFRHLLERHGLTEAIFADVNAHLADKGITLRSGTMVSVGKTTIVNSILVRRHRISCLRCLEQERRQSALHASMIGGLAWNGRMHRNDSFGNQIADQHRLVGIARRQTLYFGMRRVRLMLAFRIQRVMDNPERVEFLCNLLTHCPDVHLGKAACSLHV